MINLPLADLNLNKEKTINDFTKLDNQSLLNFKKTILIQNNYKTDILFIDYSDKSFVSITTTGKGIGVGLFVKSEKIGTEFIYSVINLLGKEEPILQVFARSLAEKLQLKHSIEKPLFIGISVEKEQLKSTDLFHTLEAAILHFYIKKKSDSSQEKF